MTDEPQALPLLTTTLSASTSEISGAILARMMAGQAYQHAAWALSCIIQGKKSMSGITSRAEHRAPLLAQLHRDSRYTRIRLNTVANACTPTRGNTRGPWSE